MKKILFLTVVVSCLLLVGCSAAGDDLEEQILQESGIAEDSDYQQYLKMMDEGSLNSEGYYQERTENQENLPTVSTVSTMDGQVHVTFAENALLPFTYYLDAALSQRIDTAFCYLNPGDYIYASAPVSGSSNSKYNFSEFRVWEYDGKSRKLYPSSSDETNLVLAIPEDYTGTELSVEPVGKYEDRTLTFSDYYINETGGTVELNGKWTLDDGSSTTSSSLTISPVVSYTVSYDYSDYRDTYYIELSNPDAFYISEMSSKVGFPETSADSEYENYSVQLHPYITVTVANNVSGLLPGSVKADVIQSITVNGKEEAVTQSKEQSLQNLRCGDQIVIRVGSEYAVSAVSSDMETSGPATVNGLREYTVTVPQTWETAFRVIVSSNDKAATDGFELPTVSHAKIIVCDEAGKELKSGDKPEDNTMVTVTITPNDGYYITGKKVTDNQYQDTMKYAKYQTDISGIIEDHPIKKLISVTLDTSDDYGTCVYLVDGKEASGSQMLREEQKLELEYTLTDEGYQINRDSGIGSFIGNIFSKNKATVTIEITAELDGQTVRRDNPVVYIAVEEK